ncbi:hypothetical protein VTK56DRAFT_3944 [Thermocarpiscus australiensis]
MLNLRTFPRSSITYWLSPTAAPAGNPLTRTLRYTYLPPETTSTLRILSISLPSGSGLVVAFWKGKAELPACAGGQTARDATGALSQPRQVPSRFPHLYKQILFPDDGRPGLARTRPLPRSAGSPGIGRVGPTGMSESSLCGTGRKYGRAAARPKW